MRGPSTVKTSKMSVSGSPWITHIKNITLGPRSFWLLTLTGLRQCSHIGHLDPVNVRNCSSALLSDAVCRNRNESGCREVQKKITSSGPVQNWSSSCVCERLISLFCLVLSPLISTGCQLSSPPQCSGLPPPEVSSSVKCWCKHGLLTHGEPTHLASSFKISRICFTLFPSWSTQRSALNLHHHAQACIPLYSLLHKPITFDCFSLSPFCQSVITRPSTCVLTNTCLAQLH